MFKERKTKLTLLSLLSALVVISTASMGMIYAQEVDDSELTTFEEEALRDEEEITAATSDNETDTSAYLSGTDVSDDDDNSTEDADTAETEVADVDSLFDGLVVCDLGEVILSAPEETETAAADSFSVTPTVSVTVMSETEVAELAANETETSAADETETASAECMSLGGDDENATSTSSATDDTSDATSDAGDNATSTDGNATSMEENSTNTTSNGNVTSTAQEDEEIAVIEGQDFAPGEIVLVFSGNSIVAIDDVSDGGDIDAKVPLNNIGNSIMFVESGTTRTAEFNFDGETLIAAEGQGDIQADGTNQNELDIAEILRSGENAADIEGTDEDESTGDDPTDDSEENDDSN